MHASERCSSSEMRREENKQTSHDTAERRGRERRGGEGARHSGAPWTGARAGRVAPHRPGRLARAGRSLRERISRQPTSGTDKNISRSRPVPSASTPTHVAVARGRRSRNAWLLFEARCPIPRSHASVPHRALVFSDPKQIFFNNTSFY